MNPSANQRTIDATYLGLMLATLVGCSGASLESSEGAWVSLKYARGDIPCAGALTYLDASFVALARTADLDLAQATRVGFVASPEWVFDNCRGESGCAHAGLGGASDLTSIHELAHLVQFEITPRPHVMLGEGFAVSASNPSSTQPSYAPDGGFWTSVVATSSEGVTYPTAGDFMAYLLWFFGSEAVSSLVRGMPTVTSREQFAQAFETTMGVSLDSVIAARTALGSDFSATFMVQPECELPAETWPAGGLAFDVAYDCEDIHVAGTRQIELRRAFRSVSLPSTGEYAVTARLSGSQTISLDEFLAPCGGPSPRSAALLATVGYGAAKHHLIFVRRDAGPHVVSMNGHELDGVAVAIDLVEPAAPPALQPDIQTIIVVGRPGEVVVGRFVTDTPRTAKYFYLGVSSPTLCSDTGTSTQCSVLSAMTGFDVSLPAGTHSLYYAAVTGNSAGQVLLQLD